VTFIINEREGGSQVSFCERTGICKSSVNKLVNEKNGIGVKGIGPYFERIMSAYGNLNPVWLATGKGEPFHYTPTRDDIVARLDTLEQKMDRILSLIEKVS
jgi:hypothetical protein